MRSLTLALMLTLMLPLTATAAPETYYHWRDARGVVHVSNRADRAPDHAARVEVEARATAPAPRGATPLVAAPIAPAERDVCPPPDTSGLVGAVLTRLARRDRLGDVDTLLVAAEPALVAPGSAVLLARRYPERPVVVGVRGDRVLSEPVEIVDGGPYVIDRLAERTAATEQAAVAYRGSACPARPPLTRYSVVTRRVPSRSVCDDYRRAFAEVGVTVSRDGAVAESFRAAAHRCAVLAARGVVTDADGTELDLPVWILDAHVAQVRELATETAELTDELTVALKEIDRAARARKCW